jgi:hypothetical protein
MKKILSLLFTLLIFVGNAWTAECYLLGPTREDRFSTISSKEYDIDLTKGEAYQLTYEAKCVPIKFVIEYWGGDLYAAQYVNGKWEDIHNETPPKNSYKSFGPYNINPAATKIKLYTKTGATGYKYFQNIRVTQKKYLTVTAPSSKSLAFGNVEAGTTSSAKTITISYSSTAANVSSSNSAFKVTPTSVGNSSCGKTGSQDVTVTFNPKSVGDQNGKITIGSNTISVSGTGTLAVPTNLKVTSTDYTSISLAWDAVSGADKYYVYVGSDKVGESTTNSITFPNLEWGSTYKNVTVKAVAVVSGKDVISNPSNAISSVSTKAIIPPANVTVSNIGYDHATITWSSATAATFYVVYVDDEFYTETTETTCQITGISLGEAHTTKVESKLNNKETTTASEISFTTYDLQAPLTVVADQEHTSYSSVPLLWDAVTDATGYCIVNKTSGEVVTVSGQTTNSYLMNGLEMNTRYSFNVYPLYNGQRSKHYRTSNVVVTKKMDIDLTDCMIYENTTEQEFFMSSGESYYPDNNGYVMPKDERVQYTQKLTFQIKKNLGYVGRIYDVRLYIKVGNKWQDSYIWNGNDLWTDGSSAFSPDYQSQDYKTVTVTLPKNVTAIRFRGSSFSGLPTEWAKYGGNKRYIKDVRVYTMAEAEVSPQDINYNLYIGQKESKTFNLKYSNRADVKFNIDNPLFNVEFPSLTSCTVGNKDISVSFKPETLDSPVQGSISIMNGDFATVALNATVKALPAPENFKVSGTTSQSVTLTWDDVNITETGYKVICKQGDNVIETKNLGGDATTCTFEGLQPNKEYTYIITTMYNSIENESAEITGKTNMLPAPQNFALDVTSVRAFSARFTWNKVAEATGYKLEWQWNEEVAAQTATVGDVSEYKITELEPDTKYSVKITTLYGDEEHGASDNIDVTTTCVINTIATGDEPHNQLHTVTLLSGEQLDDLSFVKGSTIKFKSYTNSTNIKFVQLNVTINGSKVSYSVPEIEIEVSSNVFIESVYEYAGIAQVVDEHGDVVYGTLTDAVNAAEEGATINLLNDVEQDMVVNKYVKFNGNGHDIDNLYIKKNGNVELTGDVTVVKDFGLEVSAARSGQFLENGGQIQVTGRAYIDKVLEEDGVGDYNKWYSVAVPFQVSIKDGIYIVGNDGSETKAKFNSDYAMFEYDGALRAAGTSRLPEWALADSEKNMKVGTFYLFGLGKSGPNVFRFYKADNAELITLDKTLKLTEYASSKSIDAGWNGIGNSQLYHVGIETTEYQYAQVLENNKFTTVDIAETSFAVTTPMFIQAAGDGSVSLNPKKDGTLRSASVSSAVYNIRLAKEGAEKYSDQMFASASSDATGSYTIGRDLVKFEVSTAYPQLYTRGFNTNLSVHEAAYNELSIAEMPLYMFAPEAGNYTLSLGKEISDGSALYLVKNGAEIHNFNADGAYTLYLAKGTDSSYTLRIKGENGDIPTPVIDNKAGKVKVYIEEGVLVIEGLDNGESYMVGNTIRTLYSGVSNGNNIRIALPEYGIYLVNAKESRVKILNK